MTEFEADAAVSGSAQGAVQLRHMRVETDFRRATQSLERQERDKYSSMLWNMIRMDRKPKVAILDVVGPRGENDIDYRDETSLKASVDHYHRRINRGELVSVLKYYTVYLMQRARKEGDATKQLFLIFKAVEFSRMIVQYSPYAISADAEALIFGVFHDLTAQRPGQFNNYVETEKDIFNTMKKLHFSPVDTGIRLQLAEDMIRQTSFFDALVQYQYLLARLPRMPRESDSARGRVFIKIGEIFQNLIDYVEEGPAQFHDARKLRSFIERYNRDYAERGKLLPRITGPDAGQIRRAIRAMRTIAITWHQRALAVRMLGPRMVTRLVALLAENCMKAGLRKEAHNALHTGYRYWRRVPESIDSIHQRVEYLNLMISVGTQLRQKDTVNFASQQLREFQNRLSELEMRRTAAERRRQAVLDGEEYSE